MFSCTYVFFFVTRLTNKKSGLVLVIINCYIVHHIQVSSDKQLTSVTSYNITAFHLQHTIHIRSSPMSTWDSEIDAWLIFIRGVCLRPQILSETCILKTLHFDLY